MILEADRIIADWLADTQHGVNALLASNPRDGDDAMPALIATITDETRDGDAARGELPALLPAIVVSVDVVDNLDGSTATVTGDGQIRLRIRVALENPTSERAVTDLSYYLRAVQQSLRILTSNLVSQDARTRNMVYLESVLDMKVAIVWTPTQADGSTAAGYVLPTLQCRELLPTGS